MAQQEIGTAMAAKKMLTLRIVARRPGKAGQTCSVAGTTSVAFRAIGRVKAC